MPRTKEAFEAMRENTKQRIKTQALSLFARKGLSVTVDEIMRESGLSKGLLYNHYQSKEDLINELIADAVDVSANFVKAVADGNSPASEKVRQITAIMHQMISSQKTGVDFFMFMSQAEMGGFRGEHTPGYSEELPNPVDSLARIIIQGQAEGSVVDGNPARLATVYWAAIQGLCCYSISGKDQLVESEMLSRIILREDYL